MKTFFYCIICCLLVASCKDDTHTQPVTKTHDGYIISGSAPGLYNGLRAYLKTTDEKGFLRAQDTAIIINEAFYFEGKTDNIEPCYLEINSLDGYFPFVIDNASFKIIVNKDNIKYSTIEGNIVTNRIAEYNRELLQMNNTLDSISDRYRKMIINKESVAGMSSKINDLKRDILEFPHEFISANTDNPYCLVLLNNMIRRNASDKGLIVASFDALNDSLKTSNLGKRIARSIPKIRREYEIIAATHIGKVAPDFSAPNPNGKLIALSDIKGKATLIHFWSSWFKASRRENARLTTLYEKYHDQGLEMIGVSLDGNKNQSNPKSDWKKAIKDDKLVWPQISNLSYFNDTICKAYNVRSLPSTLLLDSEGVIVAKNLTGKSLEDQLEALLK